MSTFELAYCKLVSDVLKNGDVRPSRVGNTISIFGAMLSIDCMEQGHFPILTQRKIFTTGVLSELAAFLRGAVTVQEFKDFGCNYWDANAAKWAPNIGLPAAEHIVGKIYGYQWRRWADYLDQIKILVKSLRTEPYSRRHLLTTYDPAALEDMCLPPCHLLAQFNMRKSRQLDCAVTMRSVDLCLGLPSDIVLYATLLLLVCNETGCIPGKLTFMLGDAHVYENHMPLVPQQFLRGMHPLPTFRLNTTATLDNFVAEDLELNNYIHSGVLLYALNT